MTANQIKKVIKAIKSTTKMSTNDLMQMDLYKLNTPSLKAVATRLIRTANQRLRRLEAKNVHRQSSAYRGTIDKWRDEWISGKSKKDTQQTSFTIRGIKTHGDLEKLVKEVKNFLKAPSSTLKGLTIQREDVKTELGEFESEEQEKDFWELYNHWQSTHKNISARFNDSFQIRDLLYDYYVEEGRSGRGASSKLTRAVNKMLNDVKEQKQEDDTRAEDELKNGKISFNTADF